MGGAYRRQGYEVAETGGGGADGGIDLKLRRNDLVTVVQCKQWRAWKVGVKPIRELYGVMMAEKAHRAIFVTSGEYTEDARAFALGKPLELIDGAERVELIRPGEPSPNSAAPKAVAPTITCLSEMREFNCLENREKGSKCRGAILGMLDLPELQWDCECLIVNLLAQAATTLSKPRPPKMPPVTRERDGRCHETAGNSRF